jgi:predicted O-methyltransferase YrrM
MSNPQWQAVENFLNGATLPVDPALDAALAENAAAGLPPIDVSPAQGRLLNLIARLGKVSTILEIGTLGGYSTIWLARALSAGGHLLTLELEPKHAEVARENLNRAGVGDRVEIRVGMAADLLPQVGGPFDLIFIDADKPSNPIYWKEALRLSDIGTLIIVDNVVRDGAVADEASEDPGVLGVRALMEIVAKESRVEAAAIQTVGTKGYDGFLTALVVA